MSLERDCGPLLPLRTFVSQRFAAIDKRVENVEPVVKARWGNRVSVFERGRRNENNKLLTHSLSCASATSARMRSSRLQRSAMSAEIAYELSTRESALRLALVDRG